MKDRIKIPAALFSELQDIRDYAYRANLRIHAGQFSTEDIERVLGAIESRCDRIICKDLGLNFEPHHSEIVVFKDLDNEERG